MREAAIVWFRQDLRLANNPALSAALDNHQRIIPVFIHAGADSPDWGHGAGPRWWLHHSLKSLGKSLHELLTPEYPQ